MDALLQKDFWNELTNNKVQMRRIFVARIVIGNLVRSLRIRFGVPDKQQR